MPCKREFPRLAALHARHQAAGLAVISVSLDDPAEHGAIERIRKFLIAQNATCTNYLLDEKAEVWQAKLRVEGPPLVFVFNRQGRLEQKFADKKVDYEAIGKLVVELLKN